jgi:hypothetical protein
VRARVRWTGRTRLLWLFAFLLAGVLSWLEWRSRGAEQRHAAPSADETTVEIEVVE